MRESRYIYPYSNTIICIEESKLLKQFQYDIVHDAPDIWTALAELNKMNYFHTYENADVDNYSTILDGLMKDTFTLMKEIVPDRRLWRMFALYYDIHNMKLVAKERHSGRRHDRLAMSYGSYSLPTIRSAAVRESDDILENAALTAGFFEALRAEEMYDIDFILDRTYFRALSQLVEQLGCPGIARFVLEKTDLYNVSVFFQAMAAGNPKWYFPKAFSDQGSYTLREWQAYIGGDMSGLRDFPLWRKYSLIWEAAESRRQLSEELDVLIDNYLISKTKACKLMAFGIEPICAYFFNKSMEITNIRILLAGKKSGYSAFEIKRRMRIPYEL
ncbi:MAG: V-type ATPase subunit [Oscillospiraceae bacterium]|nr:V-type ATPase subunit [Oscillospiraceae bacterium]